MKRSLFFALLLSLFSPMAVVLGAQSALAAQDSMRTVKLDVDKMTCGMCPITVRMAIEKVPGVSDVTTKYEGDGIGWAKVTFDPSKTNVKAFTQATANAGYPSRLSAN